MIISKKKWSILFSRNPITDKDCTMRRKEERIDDYSIEEKSEFAEDKEMDQELVSF